VSFAAYVTYQTPEEASLAILCLDQHTYDGRVMRASYGRTKYCKYFLKNAQCMTKECPYKHMECIESDILTPSDMQNK
jgi:CCR4-NOT transcription complex subunit 4